MITLEKLLAVSSQVAATRSRLKKRAALADCLSQADGPELGLVMNYLSGTLPQGRIGLGPAVMGKLAAGNPATVEPLPLATVDQLFSDLAQIKGAGSGKARARLLESLYAGISTEQGQFLTRLVLGELRQGALEAVLIEALADAFDLPSDEVRRAVMLASSPAQVAEAVQARGAGALDEFQLTLFQPVKPMLAQPAENMTSALETLGTGALEVKLDGARVQIHVQDQQVVIYTRQLNEVTASLPEVVEEVLALGLDNAIFDGEVLALRKDGRPLPFQVTMRRFGRRLNVEEMREKIPLGLFVFDCLMLNSEPLIDRPTRDRIAAMEKSLPPRLQVQRLITDSPLEASGFLTQTLEAGHEGVMAKSLDAVYAAGSRGAEWLKIKQAHTLDLVILAAEWGSGRRKGKLSNLHLGARDEDSGDWVMMGKTFKGLTDRMLAWQTEKLLALETHRDGNVVFVRPALVAEIAFSDVQQSPQYPAGMALRFARVKSYRKDKSPDEADTLNSLRTIHAGQV